MTRCATPCYACDSRRRSPAEAVQDVLRHQPAVRAWRAIRHAAGVVFVLALAAAFVGFINGNPALVVLAALLAAWAVAVAEVASRVRVRVRWPA